MINYIIDNKKISAGNFSFIIDVTGSEELYNKLYDAERNLKVNYMDCSHKFRMAFEAFALHEETMRRKKINQVKSLSQIKEDILDEVKQPASVLNYKNIVISLCEDRKKEFSKMLFKYGFLNNPEEGNDVGFKLKKYIRYLYAFGSVNSHNNESFEPKYSPNKENCIRIISSFHDYLCIYYGVNKKFDSTLIPINDYIPVPSKVCEDMGLSLEKGKYLYIKENKGSLAYYFFSSDLENISNAHKRDVETINKLWEDNFGDPVNIIRQVEYISSSNGDYRFQIYALPNKPMKLTSELVSDLHMSDKLDIIKGICRGVLSIHEYEPALYHRNICPDAFYIFIIRGKYKPLLAKFDCIKYTTNADFTVYNNVKKKFQNEKTSHFFAPEVIASTMGQGVDWKKADIYSLAKTCLYILTGDINSTIDDINYLTDCCVDDGIIIVLFEMLNIKPSARPSLRELLKIL